MSGPRQSVGAKHSLHAPPDPGALSCGAKQLISGGLRPTAPLQEMLEPDQGSQDPTGDSGGNREIPYCKYNIYRIYTCGMNLLYNEWQGFILRLEASACESKALSFSECFFCSLAIVQMFFCIIHQHLEYRSGLEKTRAPSHFSTVPSSVFVLCVETLVSEAEM